MKQWLAVALALALTGCATRITTGVYTDGDGGLIDPFVDMAATPVDLAEPIDLALSIDFARGQPPQDDLAEAGKSCGEIVQCLIGCGLMIGGCQLTCFQGASPSGLTEASALVACAAQKCLASRRDGGQGNILVCIIGSCGNQVAMCQGFGFGGM